MGVKRQDGTFDDECLAKVKPGEPFFVIRAQDRTAPDAVRQWAYMARAAGAPPKKWVEAEELARRMEDWQRYNAVKVPD